MGEQNRNFSGPGEVMSRRRRSCAADSYVQRLGIRAKHRLVRLVVADADALVKRSRIFPNVLYGAAFVPRDAGPHFQRHFPTRSASCVPNPPRERLAAKSKAL